MQRHENIQWDAAKAESNFSKHGVTFETAAQVLTDNDGDLLHLESHDADHAQGEDRWITIGSLPTSRGHVFFVVWTIRQENTIRIISARKVTKQERKQYENFLKNIH